MIVIVELDGDPWGAEGRSSPLELREQLIESEEVGDAPVVHDLAGLADHPRLRPPPGSVRLAYLGAHTRSTVSRATRQARAGSATPTRHRPRLAAMGHAAATRSSRRG